MKITKIEKLFYKSFPENGFFQLSIIPGISIFKYKRGEEEIAKFVESYVAITFSWIFWQYCITVYYE